MADTHKRELERLWLESRDPVVEARYVRARIRSSSLSPPRIELLASLGHAVAREHLGLAPQTPGTVRDAVRELPRWDTVLVARATAIAARLALPAYERVADRPGPAQAIVAVETWCACPCPEHRDPLFDLAEGAGRAGRRLLTPGGLPSMEPGRQRAYGAALAADRAAMAVMSNEELGVSRPRLHELQTAVDWVFHYVGMAGVKEAELSAAISESLVPTALGHGDAIKDAKTVFGPEDPWRTQRAWRVQDD